MSAPFQKIEQDPALPTGNTPLAESPIIQVETLPWSFNEMMGRQPKTWSPQDIQHLIENLRKSRNQWAEEEAQARAAGKKTPRAKLPKGSSDPALPLSLDDLDIKI